MGSAAGYDYVAVGHVSVDELLDERGGHARQPGGGALYSGLQAARLGLRTLILTRGEPEELRALLSPFAGELDLRIAPAEQTTTLETAGVGSARRQRLRAWAGPIDAAQIPVRSAILHLAPIARETPPRWRAEASLVGLTPQGLVRRWDPETREIALVPLAASSLPPRCDAIAFSEAERESCGALLGRGALVAVTAGAGATEVHLRDGEVVHVPPVAMAHAQDDLGAGDVFAAAFFVALLEGRAPAQAAAFGNAAAAVRIGGRGPEAIGDRATIERLLA
jgi:sugar/nucleoside kinase (ribokinase family)